MMRALLTTTLALALAGCGGQAFGSTFAERQDPEMTRVLEELDAVLPREAEPVIVAVTRAPAGLLLWDLREGRERWRIEADVRSAPIVAGDHVVTAEAGGIVARRLVDGQRVVALDDPELHLVGADGEAGTLVISLARGEGDSPLGVVVGVREGGVSWAHDLPLPVGVPAVAGSLVIVPWAHQRVSILDATTGVERFRVRLERSVVGHALHHGSEVYVGQHQLLAVSEPLFRDERQQRAGLEPQARPLPAQPPILPDAYAPRPDVDSAHNRVRLAWALDDAEPAAFTDGALYFVFYRMVFGLASGADEVRWAQARERDVIGASAVPGGVLVLTEDGGLALLSATDGRPMFEATLGTEVRAADLRAAGFTPPASASIAPAETLQAQLHRAASLRDPRIGAGRAYAIRFLARDESPEVTAQLIALCADRSDTTPARAAACEQVATRTHGEQHVLAALHEGASFLDGRASPPVGALARAAATMRLRQAVPFLLQHLDDPATPAEELPGLFDGLATLGDRRAITAMESFVRLYHADATDAGTIEAVGAATAALLRLAPDRIEPLTALSVDPLASAPVRARMATALVPVVAPVATEPAPVARAPRTPEPPPEPALPPLVTREMLDELLAPVQQRLVRCLEREGADPLPSARILVMLDDQSAIQTVSVTPAELQPCAEPLVRTRTFPRTRQGRQVIVHTVRR